MSMFTEKKLITTPSQADDVRDAIKALFVPTCPMSCDVLTAGNTSTGEKSYRVIVQSGYIRVIARAHNRFTADYIGDDFGITYDGNSPRAALDRLRGALDTKLDVLKFTRGLISL